MKLEVTKEFRFEAAHRLVQGYSGKCRNVHGHSWVVRVTLRSMSGILDQFGFVKDFGDFKPLRDWIDLNLDHSMMVSKEDMTMLTFLSGHGLKYHVMKRNPTSEQLCLELKDVADRLFSDAVVSKIEVEETCTSKATLLYYE